MKIVNSATLEPPDIYDNELCERCDGIIHNGRCECRYCEECNDLLSFNYDGDICDECVKKINSAVVKQILWIGEWRYGEVGIGWQLWLLCGAVAVIPVI